ncbi:MAG TPA: signal peptidase II [Dehalococcoidia bacterium]|nr:signal peptidase II [Dehalococcoidia bacterium]
MENRAESTTAAVSLSGRLGQSWFIAVALAVVAADQATKWSIRAWLDRGDRWPDEGPFRIIHVTNSGAAFGLFEGAGVLLILASLVGVAAILVYLFNPGFAYPVFRLGLALMLGGAAGNLFDRLREGEVVDFLKVPNWPAFNVADSAITVGVVLLLWMMVFQAPQQADQED